MIHPLFSEYISPVNKKLGIDPSILSPSPLMFPHFDAQSRNFGRSAPPASFQGMCITS